MLLLMSQLSIHLIHRTVLVLKLSHSFDFSHFFSVFVLTKWSDFTQVTSHLWRWAGSLLILRPQRCCTCRLLHHTCWHVESWCLQYCCSWWTGHFYRRKLRCWKKVSWFCRVRSHGLPPSPGGPDSPGSQDQLNTYITVVIVSDIWHWWSTVEHISDRQCT